MCGVFGFVSTSQSGPSRRLLRELALVTERRGRHAHGFAWIDPAGRLRRYKAPGRISANLGCLDRLRGARMVVAHCRYSTSGTPEENGNNHPHPSDGGWIVHNGTIYNAERLAFEWGLPTATDCDSETLGLLMEEQSGTLLERAAASMNLLEGPAVMLGLWSRPARMIVARRGKPLHIDADDAGNLYFASLPERLTDPGRVLDNTVRVLTVHDGAAYQTIQEIEPCRRRKPENDPRLGRPLRPSSLSELFGTRSSGSK